MRSCLVRVVSLLFTFWPRLHVCISPSLLKTKFQKDCFPFQSSSFVYMKENESRPMHGAVIFRMKSKCTLLKSSLSRLEI